MTFNFYIEPFNLMRPSIHLITLYKNTEKSYIYIQKFIKFPIFLALRTINFTNFKFKLQN